MLFMWPFQRKTSITSAIKSSLDEDKANEEVDAEGTDREVLVTKDRIFIYF